MSKNVAVFVDVANIFYAAKAAGVDIDYVTLLKSAIAGRDFVRAYAYTGLDPENENQRQFHSFLARSGYKVVSKDVRKYGDGKVKANLDIELVVDLMRTAVNLDVAVVVSGDGDFAPAIRAVQQQGVRVEVISFRGNTSSDLIEVADSFTDITQVAKVEKGSRSGRRVAAEGDLSMTEVPEKETEGTGRRRRTQRTRREAPAAVPTGRRVAPRAPAVAPSAAASAAGLIVLPGEKLARAGSPGSPGAPEDAAEEADIVASRAEATDAAASDAAVSGERIAAGEIDDDESPAGRRRRRRRGGRGRGRGRGAQPELSLVEGGLDADSEADSEAESDDDAEFETPPRAPQTTFGSVWDSQLGVPASGTPLAEAGQGDESDVEEPEIPEYLLAERRQQRQRPPQRGRGGGRAAAYQSAVERERFGRPGGGRPAGGGPIGGGPVGGGPGGGGGFAGRRPPQRGVRGRPPRPVPTGPDRFAPRPSVGGDPWSEVPPELEELLRAQITQSGGKPSSREDGHERSSVSETQATMNAGTEAPAEAAPKRGRSGPSARGRSGSGTRSTRARATATSDSAEAAPGSEGGTAAPSETSAKTATPRRRSTARATTRKGSTAAGSLAGEAQGGTPEEAPARPTRRRATPRSRPSEAEPTEG